MLGLSTELLVLGSTASWPSLPAAGCMLMGDGQELGFDGRHCLMRPCVWAQGRARSGTLMRSVRLAVLRMQAAAYGEWQCPWRSTPVTPDMSKHLRHAGVKSRSFVC